MSLQVRLAAARLAAEPFARWVLKLAGTARWHAAMQTAAFDALCETSQPAEELERAEAVWAASPDPAAIPADEPDVCLVDEGGGLERLARLLLGQPSGGKFRSSSQTSGSNSAAVRGSPCSMTFRICVTSAMPPIICRRGASRDRKPASACHSVTGRLPIKHDRRAVGCDKEAGYIATAAERIAAYHASTLKLRPLGKPVHKPTGREKVARRPDEWGA